MSTHSSIRGFPVGKTGQVLLGLLCLVLVFGFFAAAMLVPDPRGYGTHRGLGLPPCSVQTQYNIPCPTCGMTTCFAHFVRGEFLSAVAANAAGFVLACVCVATIPWCCVSIRHGCLWGIWQPNRALYMLIGSFVALALAQWGMKLLS